MHRQSASTTDFHRKLSASKEKLDLAHTEARKQFDTPEKLRKFNHNVATVEEINEKYQELDKVVETMEGTMLRQVTQNRKDFIREFTGELRNLHADYRDLENINMELASKRILS